MYVGPFVACNWAVGTFMLISLGTWCVSRRVCTDVGLIAPTCHRTLCQKSLTDERKRVQQVVEAMPLRYAQKNDQPEETKDASN